jgi:hypothetical protein
MTERKLVANVMRTPDGTILQSYHVHDYVEHLDANGKVYMVDGGISYTRRSWYQDGNGEDLSVYSDDPHTKIREWFRWGTYGKEGKGPLKWVAIKNLETAHIKAILDEGYARTYIKKIFEDEIELRKGKPLGLLVKTDDSFISCYDGVHDQLHGFCIQHEARKDLVNRYTISSAILEKLGDNTYETQNTIYNILDVKGVEVKDAPTS